MSPDWTASYHHVAAGAALALVTYLVARRHMPYGWAAALSLVVTMAGEALVEMVEYPLLFSGDANAETYYNTIGDITASFFGALGGTAFGLVGTWVRRRSKR